MNHISYHSPESLNEALDLLRTIPGARVLAGGTDLIARWKKSGRPDQTLISIRRLNELNLIRHDESGLFIGAGVTMADLMDSELIRISYPTLAEAAAKVGSVQVRNLATVGGNACNAAPSADTVPPLLIYEARALIVSSSGTRQLPLDDFFIGPGRSVLQAGEMLRGFLLPPAMGLESHFIKHSRRAGMDLATVGTALGMALDEKGRITCLKLVLSAVGPTPIVVRCPRLIGHTLEPVEDLRREIVERAVEEARPITDVRGSREYRLAMVSQTASDCFEAVIKKLTRAERN